jgi:mono/diheme cytochrome c family protein
VGFRGVPVCSWALAIRVALRPRREGTLSSVEPSRSGCRLIWGAGLLAVVVLVPALVRGQADTEGSTEAGTAWEEKPYQVTDGRIDAGTYEGYRRYQSHCQVCHGPDGLGSSYAPGLIESLAQIGYEGCLEAVMYGIENVTRAEQSVMPAFAEVEEVVKHVDDIYSYLKARADGVIGRGRPERLPD